MNAKTKAPAKPAAIPMTAVQSSNVAAIGHDPATRTLAVKFTNGNVYHYAGVPDETVALLRKAPSVGKALGQMVVGKFKHEKLA